MIKYNLINKMKLIKKSQQGGYFTTPNDNTRVNVVYRPIYRNHRLINVGGTSKKEVKEGFNKAHSINIGQARRKAIKQVIKNTRTVTKNGRQFDRFAAKQAADEAEAQYRKKYNVSTEEVPTESERDYNPDNYYVKDAWTGDYVKNQDGSLVVNPYYRKSVGEALTKTGQDALTGTSMVLSLLPNPVLRAAGNAMMYGQSAADVHHDVKEGNYVGAGINAAMNVLPYGINKLYRTWKPAKNLQAIATGDKKFHVNDILDKRYKSSQDYVNQQDQKLKGIISEILDKQKRRDDNPPFDMNNLFKTRMNEFKEQQREAANYAKKVNLNGTIIRLKPRINLSTGQVNPPSKELSEYLKNIEKQLQGEALVGGSTRLYGSGVLTGIPHDLELLTTEPRLEKVKQLIGDVGAEYTGNNGFKKTLQGNSSVFNSDGNHLIDVQILHQDPNGYATGQIAHNYYSRIWPQKYKELQKQWEQAGNAAIDNADKFATMDQPLPIKADDLFQILQKHPRVYDTLVAMDNYNGGTPKAMGRQIQMLYANPRLAQRIQNANTRAVTDSWKPLSLSPQEIQQARETFNLPRWVSDETVSAMINQKLIADSFGVRSVFNRQLLNKWDLAQENQALASNVAPYNGQGSGIGGNQLLGSSAGGLGGDVTAILNNRHNINSYQDFLHQFQNRLTREDPNYQKFDSINKSVAAGQTSIDEGMKQTEELAKKLNVSGFYGDPYMGKFQYFGALQHPKIGLKNYTSWVHSGRSNILEVGKDPTGFQPGEQIPTWSGNSIERWEGTRYGIGQSVGFDGMPISDAKTFETNRGNFFKGRRGQDLKDRYNTPEYVVNDINIDYTSDLDETPRKSIEQIINSNPKYKALQDNSMSKPTVTDFSKIPVGKVQKAINNYNNFINSSRPIFPIAVGSDYILRQFPNTNPDSETRESYFIK